MQKISNNIAIIGTTASGKSALAIDLAKKLNANILSLDSLSIYKEVDIVSAKPTLNEREGIKHFGIDEIFLDEPFDVTTFIHLYQKALKCSTKEGKQLIIVGGTSFYLKALIEGMSPMPKIEDEIKAKTQDMLLDLDRAYKFLLSIDENYALKIASNDTYRIEKALNLYFQTQTPPTLYFKLNPPKPIIHEALDIYEIDTPREILRERIAKRTHKMIEDGLIDEVKFLEDKYGRVPNPMKAIGIKETLSYFDGVYSKDEMIERIIIATAQLAKRQRTFNRTQLAKKRSTSLDELKRVFF